MTVGTRKYGNFCWINMLTSQPDQSMQFYSELLKWSFRPNTFQGNDILVGEKIIGCIYDLDNPGTPEGLSPLIGVMIKVADLDATVEKVRVLGGSVGRIMDLGKQGRMAVCFDPNGANFDVWEMQGNTQECHGTEVDTLAIGATTWFETLTNDVERATSFYCDLFGWTSSVRPGPPEYTSLALDKMPVAGLIKLTPEMGDLKPFWGTYITVEDADASAALAEKLGATVPVAPRDVPGMGRFAGIISPQGVFFYVFSYALENTE